MTHDGTEPRDATAQDRCPPVDRLVGLASDRWSTHGREAEGGLGFSLLGSRLDG